MKKMVGPTGGALLCLVMASSVEAALRYTLVFDIQREDDKVEKERLVEQVTVDGDKGRIDFLAPDGSKPENGGYILTIDGGKTFAWSEGGRAVCADWSSEEFFATIGKLLEKGTRFINADLEVARLDKVLEEPGPAMHGYPTTHLRLVSTFGVKGRILIKKIEYAAEQTDEIWMTSELELPSLERQWIEAMGQTGFEYVDAMSSSWDAEVTGTVLKHKNVVRLTNLQSKEVSVRTETMEVTELQALEPSQIPAGIFAKPECEQVDKGEMRKMAIKFIKNSLK